jgi:tyrosinase
MIELHTFGPIALDDTGPFERADLELYGIDHFRPSYTALVFFNDRTVTAANASPRRRGYAGSFSIFGHAECLGDEGHCAVHADTRRFDSRPSHPLTRAFKRVLVTDALRRLGRARALTVTLVVACDPAAADYEADGPLFSCSGVQLTTFS